MTIENICDCITNMNVQFFFYKNILQIIYIPNKKKCTQINYPKIRAKQNCNIDVIIGFSINLKIINIEYCGNYIQLDNICKINMKLEKNNIITFITEPNKYTEIYIKFKNIKINRFIEMESFDISYHNYYILDNNEKSYDDINNNKIIVNKEKQKTKYNKIIIVLTKIIKSIGEYFKIIFENNGFICDIKTTPLTFDDCLESVNNIDTLYLVLFNSNKFNLMPKYFIFYQIEQSKSIFLTDKVYLKKLKYMCKKAQQVWVYYDNIPIINHYTDKKKLKLIPMPFVYNPLISFKYSIGYDFCDYDIFFYGHPNDRRIKILNELKKYFGSKLKIGFGYYEHKKKFYIIKSKIILNLHYYEEAGLETCRFNEILNFNKIIVSEKSLIDKFNMILYKDIVVFVDEIKNDLSNINLLIGILKKYLQKYVYLEKIEQYDIQIKKLELNINNIINKVKFN